MPDEGEVHSDLVGPSGLEVDVEQGHSGLCEALPHHDVRDGVPTTPDRRHPLPVLRIAPDRDLDRRDVRFDDAAHKRDVSFLNRLLTPLLDERTPATVAL